MSALAKAHALKRTSRSGSDEEEVFLRYTDVPLMVVGAVFLIVWSVQTLVPLPPAWSTAAQIVIYVAWGLFAADYLVRFVLADHKGRWFAQHLVELLSVALPVLQPLRALELFNFLLAVLRREHHKFRHIVAVFTIGSLSLLIWVSSISVLSAERGVGNITTLREAVWWTVVTIATVGYGDHYPVTVAGQLTAVLDMIGGVALVGTVTGSLASWIIEKVSANEAAQENITRAEITELTQTIRQLQQAVQPTADGAFPPTPAAPAARVPSPTEEPT